MGGRREALQQLEKTIPSKVPPILHMAPSPVRVIVPAAAGLGMTLSIKGEGMAPAPRRHPLLLDYLPTVLHHPYYLSPPSSE